MKTMKLIAVFFAVIIVCVGTNVSTGQSPQPKDIEAALADLINQSRSALTENKITRVGISEFTITAGPAAKVGPYISDKLTSAILNSGGIDVIERAKLDLLIEEMRLGQSGLVDEKSAAQVGSILGIQAFLMGKYTIFGDSVEITAKVVQTETAKILAAPTVRIARTDDIDALLSPMVSAKPLQLEANLFVQRKTERGWEAVLVQEGGKAYTDDNIRLFARPSEDCYVYALMFSSDGTASQIFPTSQVNLSNRMEGKREYFIPSGDDWFWLDDKTGTETIYIIASYEPLRDIDKILLDMEHAGSEAEKEQASKQLESTINTRGIGGVRPSANKVATTTTDGKKIEKISEVVEGKTSIVRRITFKHE